MSVGTMNELKMTRTIKADQQAVWDAWTQPEHMKRWACPDPTGVRDVETDLRVGGAYRIVMEVEGNSHIAFGTYREIDPPNRIVYTWDWEDSENAMGETVVTVDFRATGDSTEVVLVHSGFPAVEAKEHHEQGWGACLMHFEGLFA